MTQSSRPAIENLNMMSKVCVYVNIYVRFLILGKIKRRSVSVTAKVKKVVMVLKPLQNMAPTMQLTLELRSSIPSLSLPITVGLIDSDDL